MTPSVGHSRSATTGDRRRCDRDIRAAVRLTPPGPTGLPRAGGRQGEWGGPDLQNPGRRRLLDDWVRQGIAPPYADPILVKNGGPGLDQNPNVQGGLRSSYLDGPVSTWYRRSTGASFCFIAGHEVPFAQSTLYPNHGLYVRAVRAELRLLQQQRFTTVGDARLTREAVQFDVP